MGCDKLLSKKAKTEYEREMILIPTTALAISGIGLTFQMLWIAFSPFSLVSLYLKGDRHIAFCTLVFSLFSVLTMEGWDLYDMITHSSFWGVGMY